MSTNDPHPHGIASSSGEPHDAGAARGDRDDRTATGADVKTTFPSGSITV